MYMYHVSYYIYVKCHLNKYLNLFLRNLKVTLQQSLEPGLVLNQKIKGKSAPESRETMVNAIMRSAVRLKMESSNAVIQHRDEVALERWGTWHGQYWYVQCEWWDYCIPGNQEEWFRILKYKSSSRSITRSSYVHFEKSFPKNSNFKISAKHDPYLYLDTGYDGTCETWEVELVKGYNQ